MLVDEKRQSYGKLSVLWAGFDHILDLSKTWVHRKPHKIDKMRTTHHDPRNEYLKTKASHNKSVS